MDDLDPQVIAALHRAAKGNPELRSAASAIFAALEHGDSLRAENAALRAFAQHYCDSGVADMYDNKALDDMLVSARALLGSENQ